MTVAYCHHDVFCILSFDAIYCSFSTGLRSSRIDIKYVFSLLDNLTRYNYYTFLKFNNIINILRMLLNEEDKEYFENKLIEKKKK